ncbi:glucuronate isomerase [Clostridium saccharoperbutylacetonicum]|uniref:Uronate isomerase n=1 Tax=Clostridium saccharoperbutylacetonicum N1-4(HMT) TaxID=931276 RepID=M1ML42_9CLOT|nr:glucuronate isomerase [Clostridium saccharoperbutylacetonicum]AGF58639.1 uronate isomerase UxaC [Clostridium saccharoperbutylacetonicum N1-4(HMT)]NRT60582.1 glucuronate isomerase [Clostridium saccharoperbutylacetonicum]NSB23896.1 glucuronate isomerase [Clostridium saccharoperbutylacetonicum]NSB43272.1 glucuronate isomerase [Clostridium saccharoperbutylacetonicum]
MKDFMDDNFLLSNETAIDLYHNYAKNMPIIDYHCHIDPKEIYENKKFENITEVWLYGDHYKWRAMRCNGIEEKYITGDANDYDKFLAWSRTIPMSIGNPLYHWTHLELQRFFGIYEPLDEDTAPMIWEKANKLLRENGFRARDLIRKSNVEAICTTDDPTDTLEYHIKLKEEKDFNVNVLPTFRPDKGIEIGQEGFVHWVKKLEEVSEVNIDNYDEFLKALDSRVRFFHSVGCRIADHGIDGVVVYSDTSKEEAAAIFIKALRGEAVSIDEEKKYKTYTLIHIFKLYHELGWVMQLHIAALRNNNTKMFEKIGANAGFDSINDESIAYPLSRLLDSVDKENSLPKTILYSLNPKDNYILGTMIGNFQGDGIPGKIQFGAAWWFNDNKDGMIEQMKALANLGTFGRFIGMLTDSRSFLSYTRHEYFRRIACNLIGEWVENGEIPRNMKLLKTIVEGICYNNAKEYFSI